MCLNEGKWENQQIISSEWIKKASSPKVNAREGTDYGYFLWLQKFGTDQKVQAYAMAGNGGNKVLAIPEMNLSVVITSTNYNNRNMHNYTDEIMDKYIVPALLKK